jgi:hypothetical protein
MASKRIKDEFVSVIIPAYNARDTIEETLRSVMAQTYRHMEVIIIDDGSRDGTADLVRRLAKADRRVRLVQKPNEGLAAARNTGIQHARGDFIAPIDADDLWHPTKIEKQIDVFRRASARVGLVYCWARAVDDQARILFDLPAFSYRGDVFAPLVLYNFIQSGSPLFRRAVAIQAGGYDISLGLRGAPMCEDLKFNLDVAERCEFELVPEFLVGYTQRRGSMSRSTAQMHDSRCIVIDEVRVTHPELPRQLFRWARAVSARACSQVYLENGCFRDALKLIALAAAHDPFGLAGPHARRTLASGLLGYMGLKARFASHDRPIGRSFFDADPARAFGRPSARWRSKRFRDVSNMRTARSQPVG